jgi:hypothetical protein
MAGKPTEDVAAFLERYILGDDKGQLCLTIKSQGGASVNVDGPFRLSTYPWSTWRSESGKPDEDVLEPSKVTRRKKGESAVHLHLPWGDLKWLRLQYLTEKDLPLLDLRVRIAFFASAPSKGVRKPELFWFYAGEDHPLTRDLPATGSGFSDAVAIAKFMQRPVKAVRPATKKPGPRSKGR